jgi:hypothetical protein
MLPDRPDLGPGALPDVVRAYLGRLDLTSAKRVVREK